MYSEYFRASKPSLSEEDKRFCRWIDRVEKLVLQQTGFHLLDLIDEMYMINFEEGMTSSEMAQIVIDDIGF